MYLNDNRLISYIYLNRVINFVLGKEKKKKGAQPSQTESQSVCLGNEPLKA